MSWGAILVNVLSLLFHWSLSIGCRDDMIQTQIEHCSCFATLLHWKGNFNSLIDLSISDCTKLTSLRKRCVPDEKSFIICTYLQDTKGKQVNTCPRIQRPILGEGFVNKENHVRYEILHSSHFLMTSFLFNIHLILFVFIFFWYYIFLLAQ